MSSNKKMYQKNKVKKIENQRLYREKENLKCPKESLQILNLRKI